MPHEGGVPFVLNSKLFSDYATKYRVAFIPPGTKAVYMDGQNGGNLNGTIHFPNGRSEEHTSELQSRPHLVCRLLLEKKKKLQQEMSYSTNVTGITINAVISVLLAVHPDHAAPHTLAPTAQVTFTSGRESCAI